MLKKTEEIIKVLNYDTRDISNKLLNQKDVDRFEFIDVLKKIQLYIKTLSEDSLEDLVISLDKKRKHLTNFTVALFGRTKAGKSTLRETLTRGNGSTIGKGSQRTTRDVKEYFWQGLRLLDTPGIEAYQGDDDTKKANDIIDQSDIVLFLTSDDSVQPGEFQAMAQLQKINKYFAVILNVKHDISNDLEDLQMFIDIPEMVFDEDRLSQHKHHIKNHIQEYLNWHTIDIVPIHAQSGFLSTKEEYQKYSSQLWELSKIEELYSLIAYQIYTNGQNLRLSTFSDSLISFLTEIQEKLYQAQEELHKQLNLMVEQRKKLRNIFLETQEEGNLKIQSECNSLFNQIDDQIGNFVKRYSDMDISARKQEWQKIVNQKNLEKGMKDVINEIFKKLDEKLKEFTQEYEYDVNNIKIDIENIKISNLNKGDTGKWIKRSGVAVSAVVGVIALATNWWNPIGWTVAAGLFHIGANFAGEWKTGEDDKNHKKDVQQEKDSLKKQVFENKQSTIKSCQDCFYESINKYDYQVIAQVDLYIQGLFEIKEKLGHTIAETVKTTQEPESEFSNFEE